MTGSFPNGRTLQPFTQDVVASDEEDARHRVFSTLGSRHRASRRKIVVDSVKQIDPADSTEAKVISAFRDGGAPAPVVIEDSNEEE